MIQIKLSQFKNYDTEMFCEYLEMQEGSNFEVLIPMGYLDEDQLYFDLFWWYHIAAYAGVKLSEIGEDFGYHVPSIFEKQFRFTIVCTDKEAFAAWLAIVTDVFVSGYTDGKEIDFVMAANLEFAYHSDQIWSTEGLLVAAEGLFYKHCGTEDDYEDMEDEDEKGSNDE